MICRYKLILIDEVGYISFDHAYRTRARRQLLARTAPPAEPSATAAAILKSVVDEHPDAVRVIQLYDRHAGEWSRDRGGKLVERTWLDRFMASLPDQRTVLDVGCGTAVPIGQYLIDQGCQLHGVDSSSAMIAMTRTRFPDHRWDVADMRTLALNGRFGGIIAWGSLFHLSPHHQRRMFPIFAQHAAPGAVLMFNSGPSAGEQIGTYQGEPLYHASLDPSEYRTLLADNGFAVIAHTVTDPMCGHRTVWLARTV
ncbi:methyltransferase [Mycolicibacterium canariasense]|uniref:Methyltransferase n=1 Tax=Mycolicibacterium canariasense TaxID=228230 RepID=A0A100W948_MYCCR|nr:methyltransferase [Mycolicibacterium canariasense]